MKNQGRVQGGREGAAKKWKDMRRRFAEEVPPRPDVPEGLPPLRERVRTRTGKMIDTGQPMWNIDRDYSARRMVGINIDRLYRPWALGITNPGGVLVGIERRRSALAPAVIHAMVLFLARVAEKVSGAFVQQLAGEFFWLEMFLAENTPGAVYGPSDLTADHYRRFVRGTSRASGAFHRFYRWCVGKGFPGYCPQELLRIEQVTIPSPVIGIVIRSRDPRKGPLIWEEQQLIVRALHNPAEATDPRDRLITWLFQELGARPAAIASLRNADLKATPLRDSFIIQVPRVKQRGPVVQKIPRKITRALGNFILSVREGGDDDFLIGGDLETSWGPSACRAFVAANGILSPRLSATAEDGSTAFEPLPLTPYRFRHTMATNLAEQGVPAERIAALLDDRTLAMALVYTNNTSELVDILEETLDRHPTWLRHVGLFLGRPHSAGHQERKLPVIQGGVPYFENYGLFVDRIGAIGWCSNPRPCELNPPLSCYRCGWFIADPDPAMHILQLEQLKDEINSKVAEESTRMVKVLRPDLFAVAEAIALTRGGRTLTQKVESKIAQRGRRTA